ncbi:MAG: HAD family hydrolase [Candidatus Hodarchaeota archaeon]
MKNWMLELAFHYHNTKQVFPNDDLLIIFDIDGTIIDLRFMVLYVLQAYDRIHNTHYFRHLRITDINVHEARIEKLLDQLNISQKEQQKVLSWYEKHDWSSKTILEAHRPYRGVLEVIRWFQIQPKTFVGLNTGRPEWQRAATLRSLNKLAEEYRVKFTSKLLFMNRENDWAGSIPPSKVRGLEYFQEAGYRVFAMIDNEPGNLEAIAKADKEKEILLLHADTIFESKRQQTPKSAISGTSYDVTGLIQEGNDLPKHIQFVWHGVTDKITLQQFFDSDIRWTEVYIRRDPFTDAPIVRHADFDKFPLQKNEEFLLLENAVKELIAQGKSIKLELKEGNGLIKNVLDITSKIKDNRLWFGGRLERIEEKGYRLLSESHPNAIIQCRIDFIAPLLISMPEKTKEILDIFTDWGINRFSINDATPNKSKILDQLDQWGFEVNIFNINSLESFLRSVLLLPQSITSNFTFPEWKYLRHNTKGSQG